MPTSFMRRIPCRFMAGLAIFVAACCCDFLHAATTEAPSSSTDDLVKEALHREIYGLHIERERLLDEAILQNPDFGPARWQKGILRHDGKWIDVDSISSAEESPSMKEYLLHREKMQDTVEGHLELANWCREKKLRAQELAHLSRVLDFNPDHPTARDRLDYRRVSGRWMTSAEIATATERREKEESAATRWRTKLKEIRRDLQQPARKEAAHKRLLKIQDVHAIPSMESIVSVSSQEGALAVVDAVASMRGQEAVDSLIRHAVFSQWPLVREGAAERLAQRKRESYVPALLNEMYTPLVSQFAVATLPNGRLGYRHSFQREGQEEQQVLVLDTEYRRIRRFGGIGEESLMRAFLDSMSGLTQREAAIARQNLMQSTYNQRLSDALNIATYQDLPADPHRWWQWWDEQNDMVWVGDKRTRLQYQLRQVAIRDRSQFSSGMGSQSAGGSARAECFAAGTLVCTSVGQKPIESIRVGDLVLSQDVESGELAFKPVVRTTVRPTGELVKTSVGQDTFETSSGHLFWVAGHGWAKAKVLESGMALHCLRGAIPVTSVDPGTKAETFNLVVADFHTYFVGQQRVLSHDVTSRRPTDTVVPGLKDE